MCRCKWGLAIAAGVIGSVAFGVTSAVAQPAAGRVELGGQVNVLRLSDSSDTNGGLGARATFNVTPWLGVEGEYQFIPDDVIETTSALPGGSVLGLRYERRRQTALFGVKAGYRGDRVGVFARVRPGFTVLSDRGVDCLGDVCALVLLAMPDYRPEFAVDVGGVLEFYPSPRWLARVDVGSLVIRHRSSAPPCAGGGCTTSNLAVGAGVAVRF